MVRRLRSICIPTPRYENWWLIEMNDVVVVEKPFTPTHQEADELVALAKKQNKLLAVYQSAYYSSRLCGTTR